MADRFDVVIVPDFVGSRPYLFEVRTLFFLASWLEQLEKVRDLPLHVACIGEPPRSVRWLASRCGAMISVHHPYGTGGFWNKFRGLEVEGREACVLMLDVDTIVCGDISGLGEFGHSIVVAPRGLPYPEAYWGPIYQSLGLVPPTERIASMVGELDAPLPRRANSARRYETYKAMTPCYNGGVIFVPWKCDLRRVWEEHLQKVSGSFSGEEAIGRAVKKDDQLCLATAIEVLRRQGIPVRRLPREYNADLTYIYRGAARPADLKIVHAMGLFRSLRRRGQALRPHMASFLGKELSSIARDVCRRDVESSQRPRLVRQLLAGGGKALNLGLRLDRLHTRYVRPALRHSA